jgi:hypothetical protein
VAVTQFARSQVLVGQALLPVPKDVPAAPGQQRMDAALPRRAFMDRQECLSYPANRVTVRAVFACGRPKRARPDTIVGPRFFISFRSLRTT